MSAARSAHCSPRARLGVSLSATSPVIYLLDGEDEFGISEFLSRLQARLGDHATAELNTSRLDGGSASQDELVSVACALPFLAARRLVIFSHPTARLTDQAAQEKFQEVLKDVPPTTALVLVENHLLTNDQMRKKGKTHWLEKWALENRDRVYLKHFPLPEGEILVKWIQERVKSLGGQFSPQAVIALANLVGDDPRLADQEIHKLMAYVNYSRPVEADEVETLTPSAAKVKDFALVNALRSRDKRQAQAILHKMMEEEDPIPILHHIVSQYRLLILAREALERGEGEEELARKLKMHPYRVRLALEQARHYSLEKLEAIYHRLLELDIAMKTSQMTGELALDVLIVELTN